jgi:hypothetical protein
MTVDQLFNEIDQLPTSEKWRLVNHILQTLEHEQRKSDNWQDKLKATYGILADDPIERPPQLPLEEREWSE